MQALDWLAHRLRGFGFVAPSATEQLAAVFGDHGGHPHDTHHQENGKEDNCNYQYWHTAPLERFCGEDEPHAVIAITGPCDGLCRQRQPSRQACNLGIEFSQRLAQQIGVPLIAALLQLLEHMPPRQRQAGFSALA
jgi:hypothetical protein